MEPLEETEGVKKLVPRTINRSMRHRKPPSDPKYTKSTHKIKKLRSKNAPTKQQRRRAIAKARKARKESYTQVS